MPATKRGVYHNLKESAYVASNGDATLFFSSRLYRDKFLEEYKEHRNAFKERLERILQVDVLNVDLLADFVCYKTIEKRGFHVWIKGVNVQWQNCQLYAFGKTTEKNTRDWQKTQKPKLDERKKIMGSI